MAELDLGMVRPALVDGLTSTRTDAALTANQGKVLKDALDAQTQTIKTTSGYTVGAGVSCHFLEAIKHGGIISLRFAIDINATKQITDALITFTDNRFYPVGAFYMLGRAGNTVYMFEFAADGKLKPSQIISENPTWVVVQGFAIAAN